MKIEKEKGDEKKKKYFVNLQTIPLSPETLPSHFEGLIFFNSETTTQSA